MATRLRIALVSRADDCVPSRHDEPTATGIKALADALVAHGHAVIVCAPIPSHSDARVVGTIGYRGFQATDTDVAFTHVMRALAAVERFRPDVVHDFSGQMGLLNSAVVDAAGLLVTASEPMPALQPELLRTLVQRRHSSTGRTALVAQSQWIQQTIRGVQWQSVIAPAVSIRDATFSATKHPYALYLEPMGGSSAVLTAVQAARTLGLPLRIGLRQRNARVDAYLFNHVSPHFGAEVELTDLPDVTTARQVLAYATLLITTPTTHQRAPHLAVRALASGTPVVVVASEERIDSPLVDGTTVVQRRMCELKPADTSRLASVDPYECRRRAAVIFGPESTASAYEQVYSTLTANTRIGNLPQIVTT